MGRRERGCISTNYINLVTVSFDTKTNRSKYPAPRCPSSNCLCLPYFCYRKVYANCSPAPRAIPSPPNIIIPLRTVRLSRKACNNAIQLIPVSKILCSNTLSIKNPYIIGEAIAKKINTRDRMIRFENIFANTHPERTAKGKANIIEKTLRVDKAYIKTK